MIDILGNSMQIYKVLASYSSSLVLCFPRHVCTYNDAIRRVVWLFSATSCRLNPPLSSSPITSLSVILLSLFPLFFPRSSVLRRDSHSLCSPTNNISPSATDYWYQGSFISHHLYSISSIVLSSFQLALFILLHILESLHSSDVFLPHLLAAGVA